ncbi:MAG: HAD-IIIA family hydrolase [Planctomycetes bacterium]|jgi:3-deoxy-D-manno-octulosonate 8-phosphate phosphatase (KDO 8-P phosphatase)|nr:HAD-IIIA family hydrolase [Planctomycetota bacterium]
MNQKLKVDLGVLAMLVLDVDGVLTDGRIITHHDGTESKCFHVLDGHGIRMWQRAGLKVAWLSGRHSLATIRRAEELQVPYVLQDCHVKLPALQKLLEEIGVPAGRVAYVGDDVMDLPVIRHVGFGAAVANAVDEVKAQADYVTTRAGGDGAVREVIEYILKGSGRWQSLMERYET